MGFNTIHKKPIKHILAFGTVTRYEGQHEEVREGVNEGQTKGDFILNCINYSRRRDEEVISLIGKGGAFTRKQIQQLIFSNRKSGKRIAQDTLKRLVKRRSIKKWVRSSQEATIYYLKRPRQIDHILLLNEVYCTLMAQKKSWYTIDFRWSYNIMGKAWADAMAIIYTQPDRKGKQVVFIEIERHPSKRFDKPEVYQKVFDSNWTNEEWCVTTKDKYVFPTVLIVTEEELKFSSPLRFRVATPAEVKEDIYSIIIRKEF